MSVGVNHQSITVERKFALIQLWQDRILTWFTLQTFICQNCHEHKDQDQDQLEGTQEWRQTMHQIFLHHCINLINILIFDIALYHLDNIKFYAKIIARNTKKMYIIHSRKQLMI